MATKFHPEARHELRDAVRYYRAIKPPVVGERLAQRVLAAFRQVVQEVAATPLARQYATSDYVERVAKRSEGRA